MGTPTDLAGLSSDVFVFVFVLVLCIYMSMTERNEWIERSDDREGHSHCSTVAF